MGVRIEGVDELAVLLRQGGDRVTQGVVEQMRREAIKIQRLAQKMAPVDEGNLEDSIKMKEEGGGRDALGRFARKAFMVFIDENAAGSRTESGTVREYARIMHEYLTPAGPLKLGPLSKLKQSGQSELVGGGFLERATSEVSRDMMKRMIDVSRSYF